MLTAQSPFSGRLKSGRRPLQPKNSPATPVVNNNVKPNLKLGIEISLTDNNSNKENQLIYTTPTKMESLDPSLAEELSAIREKLDRLRLEREKTEKLLKERDLMLEMQMNEMEKRGQVQRMLEIEVDRLYRLNQLRSSCMRVTSIRSLRDKEQEKKVKEDPSVAK
ncbi:hypothetical protein LguiA_032005 [Lonicera macranthoides]